MGLSVRDETSERTLDGVTFEVIMGRRPMLDRYGSGPWIVRVYAAGEHVHSSEGGVALDVGLREAQRAMQDFVEGYR